jgi:hypothetical protein
MQRSLARRDATLLVIALLFALQAAIRFNSHLSHDAAWFLYAAGRLIDGAVLYRDIVEVNPPLATWLAMPIAALARATGLSAALLLKMGVLLLTALSLALSARFLCAAKEVSIGVRHAILILAAALMLFVPAYDFGQREHLLILLVTPWLLLRWGRLLGERPQPGLPLLVGFLAAAGFWLKPQCLVAALAVEIAILVQRRSLRLTFSAENLAAIGFSLLYLAAIRLFAGDFYERMIALGATAYVPFYGFGWVKIASRTMLPVLLGIAALAGGSFLQPQLRLLRSLLVVAGAAFLFAFVIQAGFRYQSIPSLFCLALAAGLGVACLATGEARIAGPRQWIVAAGSTIGVATVFLATALVQFVHYRGVPFERSIAAEAPEARSVFIASTSVYFGFPMVEEKGLDWASRFPLQWLAPYVATTLDEGGAPSDDVGRYALEAMVSDLRDFAPDIVFVNESPDQLHYRGRPLDYVAFWNHDPRFAALWSVYEERGLAGDFRVYVRRR